MPRMGAAKYIIQLITNVKKYLDNNTLILGDFNLALSIFFLIFYLFMIVTERERGRDTGGGRSRLHAPGA